MPAFTECTVEEAALAWLGGLGFAVLSGPEIAPGAQLAERADFGEVVLKTHLRDALLPKLLSGEIRVKSSTGV